MPPILWRQVSNATPGIKCHRFILALITAYCHSVSPFINILSFLPTSLVEIMLALLKVNREIILWLIENSPQVALYRRNEDGKNNSYERKNGIESFWVALHT